MSVEQHKAMLSVHVLYFGAVGVLYRQFLLALGQRHPNRTVAAASRPARMPQVQGPLRDGRAARHPRAAPAEAGRTLHAQVLADHVCCSTFGARVADTNCDKQILGLLSRNRPDIQRRTEDPRRHRPKRRRRHRQRGHLRQDAALLRRQGSHRRPLPAAAATLLPDGPAAARADDRRRRRPPAVAAAQDQHLLAAALSPPDAVPPRTPSASSQNSGRSVAAVADAALAQEAAAVVQRVGVLLREPFRSLAAGCAR